MKVFKTQGVEIWIRVVTDQYGHPILDVQVNPKESDPRKTSEIEVCFSCGEMLKKQITDVKLAKHIMDYLVKD